MDRENTLRTFLNKTQDALPDAVIIWDTPAFMDIPIIRAKPVGERFRKFPELMQQILRLSEIDEKVCKDMNIPMTARTKLGRAYRGLSSDGIHYESSYGSSGWNILYEMFFQSGLAEACTGKPAHFCKKLDEDFDPSLREQPPTVA